MKILLTLVVVALLAPLVVPAAQIKELAREHILLQTGVLVDGAGETIKLETGKPIPAKVSDAAKLASVGLKELKKGEAVTVELMDDRSETKLRISAVDRGKTTLVTIKKPK